MHLWAKIYMKLKCSKVGSDMYGNMYYIEKKAKNKQYSKRFVWYSGSCEATKVPCGWHAWLHYVQDEMPQEIENGHQMYFGKTLDINHKPNLTGTKFAHNPEKFTQNQDGSLRFPDYIPWVPL